MHDTFPIFALIIVFIIGTSFGKSIGVDKLSDKLIKDCETSHVIKIENKFFNCRTKE